MAAKTPTTVYQYNSGSQNKLVAAFTDLDDADTWTSGLDGVQDWVFQRTDNPSTQTSAGVSVAESAGVFTFYPAEDNTAGKLIIYGKF